MQQKRDGLAVLPSPPRLFCLKATGFPLLQNAGFALCKAGGRL